ncbi:MAG: hypothetical protein NTY77_16985 [Elusimicrobia bacterium]|nr:hypothetical protein [Elusimicrobiota bacterium]
MKRSLTLPLLGFSLLACPRPAAAWSDGPQLWQESYFFDALLQARSKAARQQSDPQLMAVLKAVAGQVAQQVVNLQQIDVYAKAQQDNLRYAFTQPDPQPSLETIAANFETLTKGNDQIRSNLYFLTARCRMASSQALPDPELYQAGLLVLGQVQQLQLALNSLYLNATAVRALVAENDWAADKFFRHSTQELLRSVVRIQDSVFSVYNAGYEFSMRSR